MIKLKDILNEATPKEKGNLQVMKPKFKKTLDMIYKDVASIYQNLGSVEADKLKKAYIAAINKGLNPRTNMFMKNSAQRILDKAFKNESVNEAFVNNLKQAMSYINTDTKDGKEFMKLMKQKSYTKQQGIRAMTLAMRGSAIHGAGPGGVSQFTMHIAKNVKGLK